MSKLHLLPSAGQSAPRMTATTAVDGAVIVRIEAPAAVLAPDELVAFPFGLEVKAAKALIRNGTLLTARIGRRTYAKRSEIVGLVDKLAAKPAERATSAEDQYAAMVARRGRQ